MAAWVQVVILVVGLAFCVVGAFATREFCRQRQYDLCQTTFGVLGVGSFLLFFLLCAIPYGLPALGISAVVGLTLTLLDWLVLLISVLVIVWRNQSKEIATHLRTTSPPDA
jgi:hypothetical protein